MSDSPIFHSTDYTDSFMGSFITFQKVNLDFTYHRFFSQVCNSVPDVVLTKNVNVETMVITYDKTAEKQTFPILDMPFTITGCETELRYFIQVDESAIDGQKESLVYFDSESLSWVLRGFANLVDAEYTFTATVYVRGATSYQHVDFNLIVQIGVTAEEEVIEEIDTASACETTAELTDFDSVIKLNLQ